MSVISLSTESERRNPINVGFPIAAAVGNVTTNVLTRTWSSISNSSRKMGGSNCRKTALGFAFASWRDGETRAVFLVHGVVAERDSTEKLKVSKYRAIYFWLPQQSMTRRLLVAT